MSQARRNEFRCNFFNDKKFKVTLLRFDQDYLTHVSADLNLHQNDMDDNYYLQVLRIFMISYVFKIKRFLWCRMNDRRLCTYSAP